MAHGDDVVVAVGERALGAPLTRPERLGGFDRQLPRQLERRLRSIGRDRLPCTRVDAREGDRPWSRAEIEERPWAAGQLREQRARLRVRDRPIEEEIRPEQLWVVHVLRAGERSIARQPVREALDALGDLLHFLRQQGRGRRLLTRATGLATALFSSPPDREQSRHPCFEILPCVGRHAAECRQARTNA